MRADRGSVQHHHHRISLDPRPHRSCCVRRTRENAIKIDGAAAVLKSDRMSGTHTQKQVRVVDHPSKLLPRRVLLLLPFRGGGDAVVRLVHVPLAAFVQIEATGLC